MSIIRPSHDSSDPAECFWEVLRFCKKQVTSVALRGSTKGGGQRKASGRSIQHRPDEAIPKSFSLVRLVVCVTNELLFKRMRDRTNVCGSHEIEHLRAGQRWCPRKYRWIIIRGDNMLKTTSFRFRFRF